MTLPRFGRLTPPSGERMAKARRADEEIWKKLNGPQ
jgi:hypothetical protein